MEGMPTRGLQQLAKAWLDNEKRLGHTPGTNKRMNGIAAVMKKTAGLPKTSKLGLDDKGVYGCPDKFSREGWRKVGVGPKDSNTANLLTNFLRKLQGLPEIQD